MSQPPATSHATSAAAAAVATEATLTTTTTTAATTVTATATPSALASCTGATIPFTQDDGYMRRTEECTAMRVGNAAHAVSSSSPHTSPHSASANLASAQYGGLPPRGSSSGTSPHIGSPHIGSPRIGSPRIGSPRASMPHTHAMHHRRESVVEDSTGLDYPVGDEELAMLRQKRTQRNPSYAHIFPQQQWPGYRPIEEHGLIGNMHTCALVSSDAQISWYCYPHFDSPSLFAAILDTEKGGQFTIRAAVEHGGSAPNVTHRQLYHSETNVLISRFLTDSGVGQVIDYMPVGKPCKAGHGWLIRELECVRGKMYFEVICEPAFNYARDPHEVQLVTHGARFKTEKLSMVLTSSKKRTWTVTPRNGVQTKLKLVEGQKAVFIFRESKSPSAYPNEDPTKHDITGHPATEELTEHLKVSTIGYWRDWISKCTYTGRWREAVYRSALVLKLLTFEPTGAIVAAATTSLPEGIGGGRNWDYRFCWIRDSSFVLYAFIKLGFREEAAAFIGWIAKRCEESSKGDGSLQIMYGIHGEHKLEELELEHLSGYMDSKPVRIGNGAYDQVQLDIYGELLDTVYLSNKYAEPISYDFWMHIRKMVDWVCVHWTECDEGIWEVRGGQQHFVYSKVMSWVALDRGIRLAERRSFPADLPRWYNVRNTIYEEIQEKGWNPKRKAFVQHYGSETLDASVLIMPLVFFMSPTDPRFVSTLDAILQSVADEGLVSNNLVFRYNVEHTQDGLVGEEGTFSICTFWAVEAAARLGMYKKKYLEKARLMFEQMLGYANHCLRIGTRVHLSDGSLILVEDVRAGMLLLGQDGREVIVSRAAARREDRGFVRMTHVDGSSYDCTLGHYVTVRWALSPTVSLVELGNKTELRVSYTESRAGNFMHQAMLSLEVIIDPDHVGAAVADTDEIASLRRISPVLRGSVDALREFGHQQLEKIPRANYLVAGDLVEVSAEEVLRFQGDWMLGSTAPSASAARTTVPGAEFVGDRLDESREDIDSKMKTSNPRVLHLCEAKLYTEPVDVVTIDIKGDSDAEKRFVIEGGVLTHNCGLYSEEIGKRGEHLGNFPQAFTHLALISAAINLDKALNFHRGGGNFLSTNKDEAFNCPMGNPNQNGKNGSSSSSQSMAEPFSIPASAYVPSGPQPLFQSLSSHAAVSENRKQPIHIASQDETSTTTAR